MRKKFLAVVTAAVMSMSMAVTAFADTESGMLAHYTFDDKLTNEVTGEEATQTGQKFAAAAGDKIEYLDGALNMLEGNTDGLNLNVKATGDAYTFSFWAMTNVVNGFAEPILWYGGTNQSPEAWVGVWPGLFNVWSSGGPVIGGNDSAGSRPAVTPEAANNILVEGSETAFNWHMITAVIDNGKATLYYDGAQVGASTDAITFPSVTADDRSFYLGVNAWDKPYAGLVDELYVYDRALTADDVKELYDATKTVADQQELKVETIEWDKPALSDPNEFVQSTAKDDDAKDSDNTMMIVIIAVVVVVVVVVVVAVVMSSKKKNANNDEDDEEDEE